jgi:hypothetical protein
MDREGRPLFAIEHLIEVAEGAGAREGRGGGQRERAPPACRKPATHATETLRAPCSPPSDPRYPPSPPKG